MDDLKFKQFIELRKRIEKDTNTQILKGDKGSQIIIGKAKNLDAAKERLEEFFNPQMGW
jgi:hypothetical protein